jgi:sporulation protein YlmC with PRC-barrel domain
MSRPRCTVSAAATPAHQEIDMLRMSMLAAIAMAPALAPAYADCTDAFEGLQEKTSGAAISAEVRRDMNQLRSAARTLERYRKGEACEKIIETIEEIVEKRKEAHARRMERERFANAAPVSRMRGLVRVDDIKGKDVHDTRGEEIGVVEAVPVDTDKGSIAYVVMSHGGFLGIGEKLVAVPWQQFRMTEKQDALVLAISEEKLDKAPGFDDDNWPKMTDPEWRRKIDAYYAPNKDGKG